MDCFFSHLILLLSSCIIIISHSPSPDFICKIGRINCSDLCLQGNLIEFENLLGEPLRQGKEAGVPMPTLQILFQLAKAIQWRVKESKGLVDIPMKKGDEASG